MASLIPGYEYDIFISYRQKDNKHDGWVTGFVNNLKGELESTFKEEVSVYFDINPHDGLLETHDVDESLKEKLKCAVFIPIISRTYCDPKSFAWEHEFKAFVDQASQDQYGLKVKLPNGNVAGRVLPVRIHELDNNDIKLCESVLGGVLRGVEFIFKSPGVNRPLLPKEENPQENQNHTSYRDQINKVANAVQEIISGMMSTENSEGPDFSEAGSGLHETEGEEAVIGRKKRRTGIVIGLILILFVGALLVSQLLGRQKLKDKQIEKTIAVLPFWNDSPDQENTYFINGLMDEVLNNLQKIKDFSVISRTSVEQYRERSRPSIPKIAKELGVNYIVEGSGQKYGNSFRLRIQLIEAASDKHLWSESYDQEIKETEDIFLIQSQIAQAIASELKATITPEEKHIMETIPTRNLTALDFYQRGKDEYSKFNSKNPDALKRAEDLFNKALKDDSRFGPAYTGLARVYWDKQNYEQYFSENYLDSVRILCDIALSYDNQLSEAYKIKGDYYRAIGLTEESEEQYDNALKFNPNDWSAYFGKGLLSLDDLLKQVDNFHKAVSLNHGPELPGLLINLGSAYLQAGFFEKSKYYYQQAFNLDDNMFRYLWSQYNVEYLQGHFEKAGEIIEKMHTLDTNNVSTLNSLGFIYMYLGRYDESLKYFEKWLNRIKSIDPLSMGSMHRIGYIYWKNGNKKEAELYFDKEIDYCNKIIESKRPKSQTLSVYYDLAGVYAFRGDKVKAYENLRIFNQKQTRLMWIMYIKNDPLFDSLRSEPVFQNIVSDIEARNQAEHERIRKWLEEQGML